MLLPGQVVEQQLLLTFAPSELADTDSQQPNTDHSRRQTGFQQRGCRLGNLARCVGRMRQRDGAGDRPEVGEAQLQLDACGSGAVRDDAAGMLGTIVTTIHHINCGTLVVPTYPTVVCHSLLLQDGERLALVDTGIGLQDVRNPVERLGQPLIDVAGFQFNEPDTAVRRLEALGVSPGNVQHIILTHGDPDHAGGLADFPNAKVHVSEEELAHVAGGHWRYCSTQFAHAPSWKTYGRSARRWFGLEARSVEIGFSSEVLLIPLFGHTLGHCGVAIQQEGRWLLHVGDAYYLRVELTTDDHPVSQIAAQRADDDAQRRASLQQLRRLVHDHASEMDVIGYHDLTELPAQCPLRC